jgi:Domain of unknown function (DUF5753)
MHSRAAAQPAQLALPELLELLDRARIEYASFRERFTELAGADRLQDAIAAAETAATRIAHYEPTLVPGILQTADYARELLHLPSGPAQSGADEAEISRMIASRLRRQAILYESGREIMILMGEGALRTRLAAAASMRAQREHIARLAETLPPPRSRSSRSRHKPPIATLNGWVLTDDLATIETDAGNLEMTDPEHVQRYWHHTHLLLDAAETGSDAAAVCRDISDEIDRDSAPA